MGSRRRFKHIAHGLFGSFISRNNDVDGFWGIGMLRKHAEEHRVREVQLDLMQRKITPTGFKFEKLVGEYGDRLNVYLDKNGSLHPLLTSALIQLNFEPDLREVKLVPRATWGDVFMLTVVLADDLGNEHGATGYGRCGVHDPKRELRSTRFISSL